MNLSDRELKFAVWMVWVVVLIWHPLLGCYFLPTAVAASRRHRHPLLVGVLNLFFGWTPSWLLVLLYAVERPDRPYKILRRRRA